ncbi:hypothetical protein [Falsiroseomonas oryzae]|uniref:hypothetical protein n=1 Tax=Falsiroseomonas oryzae TaxID=2766473 RepID=UPI0022EB4BCA|nr:hypothetical protein [Roseomonas sp. MO-31]
MSDTATLFAPLEDDDPARPGDPFSRLRYHYGQLLGAEDFAAEQRYHVLRERLLTATLHGHGTVWGLRVTAREDAASNAVQLVCAPGLAVDALGRLIHVEQEVCLDVTGLALAPFWSDLSPPPGAEAGSRARRAFVVLSYRACLADEVPAIAPPCSDSGEAMAHARLLDRWRLCLAAEAPPDPHPLARDGSALPAGDLRAALLEFILSPPAELSRFWSGGDEAPLLLATVDLEPVGDPAERTRLVAGPDNAVRALLPDVQTVAAVASGARLIGAGAAAAFALDGATAASDGSAVTVTARFSRPPQAASVSPDSLRVFRFDPGSGWVEAATVSRTSTGNEVAILLGEDWTAETTWQLVAIGAGPAPLLDAEGNPLGGVVGQPQGRAPTAGRDASLVLKFVP